MALSRAPGDRRPVIRCVSILLARKRSDKNESKNPAPTVTRKNGPVPTDSTQNVAPGEHGRTHPCTAWDRLLATDSTGDIDPPSSASKFLPVRKRWFSAIIGKIGKDFWKMQENQEPAKEATSEKQITLDEARLQIGDLVQLQSQTDGNDTRYSVRLIGLSKGRSVLVTTPMIEGKYLLMRDGQSFVLRAFSGKNAYAFATQIIKSINTPYPYLHLAFPKEVRSLVVRKGARAAVNLVCAITSCDDVPMQAAGTIVNLSIGGALLTAKQPLGEKGQRLMVKFRVIVNGIEALLEINAIIRVINIDESGETIMPYNHGLQFVDVAAEDSIPLLAYVYHELLEQSLGA
jgi:c-di-GMP-binding flagellar brake protein YcgR